MPPVPVRGTGQAATFTALHEPYTGVPKLRRLERPAKRKRGDGDGRDARVTDYVCVAFDD